MKALRTLSCVVLVALAVGCPVAGPTVGTVNFSVTADMRSFTGDNEYRGALRELVDAGPGDFMISPGDIDPPAGVHDAIQEVLGPSFDWYPVIGNHEAETPEDMAWLRAFNPGGTTLPRIVNPGPLATIETCYSFDAANVHFAVINEYFHDSVDDDPVGDVSTDLLTWLEADLAATAQPVIFVIGHEPAFPQPDMEVPHRLRHEGDSLDQFPANRDAFWVTLVTHNVTAYICGHTHNYSIVKIDGVWQIDAGHARGLADMGAASTFMNLTVTAGGEVFYRTWRQNISTGAYRLRDEGWL